MRTPSNILQEHFQNSNRFYYLQLTAAATLLCANPFFHRSFNIDKSDETNLPGINQENMAILQKAIQQVVHTPGSQASIELLMQATSGYVQVSWELTARPADNQEWLIDGIGCIIKESATAQYSESVERYKDFIRNNIETIWRFELSEPMPIHYLPHKMIEHCRKYGYLAECNDTMARLYGFTNPADLYGKKLDELMDIQQTGNKAFLHHFFTNHFKAVDTESQQTDSQGCTRYFSNTMMGVVEEGYLKRVWGSHREITDKKHAEKALIESEKRFRDVANTAPVIIWMSDALDNLVYVNQHWIDFTGISQERIKPDSWKCLIHPEDVESTVAAYKEAFAGQQSITLTYRLLRSNGEYCWVQETCMPRVHVDGEFIGFIGSIVDINDQKTKEVQLLNQAAILNNVFDIIVSTELDGTIKSFNKIAETFFDLPGDAVIGKNISEVVTLDYIKTNSEAVQRQLFDSGSWKGEVLFTNQQESKKYLLNTLALVKNEKGTPTGIVIIGKDITERKLAEQQLEQSELFYRNLISNSLDGMLIVDEGGLIRFSSPSVQHILGYTPSELIGEQCFTYVHQADLETAQYAFVNEVNERPEVKSLVIRLKNRDGNWVWCMVRAHNLVQNRYVKGIVIYFHDDTLRTEARAALKESEARFRNMITDLQLGVMVMNAQLEITLCNKHGLELLGYAENELIGKTTFHPEWDTIDETGKKITAEERPTSIAFRTNTTVKDFVMGIRQYNSNNRIWVITNAVPVHDAKGNILHVITSFTDITERKKLQQKLFEEEVNKQRLLTQATIDGQEKERKELGKELHDNFGQQLTTIKLFMDMARSTANDTTLEMINMGIRGIGDVINEIRNMSRSLVPPSLGDLGLVDSVKELCSSLKRTQQFNIRFYQNTFNEDQLKPNQSLMIYRIIQEQLNNIIKHAQARSVILRLSSEFGLITLDIVDNGIGFDPDNNKKGLGILNIINRAELFNGKVDIQTAPGQGCKLKVVFPLYTAEAVLN